MLIPVSQSGPATELNDLLQNVTACLESPDGESLVACQKHLLRVIDLLQLAKVDGIAIPPATRTTVQHINSLRRQADTLLFHGPNGASAPLAYRRDGSAELTNSETGNFEMEL